MSAPLLLAATLAGAGACGHDPVSPERPPYLAIVSRLDAPAGVTVRDTYSYHVRELAERARIETVLGAAPGDTVILPVLAGTYLVELAGVGPMCGVRGGGTQVSEVKATSNTTVFRYTVTCRAPLAIEVVTTGHDVDPEFVYELAGPDFERAGLMGANDTVRVDGVPPGEYHVTLRHVAPNCFVVSNGGPGRSVSVPEDGGATLTYRVACSDERRRPRVVSLLSTHRDGAAAFVLRAVDPDRDVERYFWTVTDCRGTSVLPGGGNVVRGLLAAPAVARRDTAVVVGAFELGMSADDLAGRCAAAWVGDYAGNTSPMVEVPLAATAAEHAPVVTSFAASLPDTILLRTELAVSDPDGDFIGAFPVYAARDGALVRPADGRPDRIVYHPAGVVGAKIPDVVLGQGYGSWRDYLGVTAYLVDAEGNFARVEDLDLFR